MTLQMLTQCVTSLSLLILDSHFCLFVQAEARLAARRQARYEARNIRMRELEKKQKADEEGGTVTNNHSGLNSSNSGPHSLIQHTSSSNSNHNNSNIHSASGKRVS